MTAPQRFDPEEAGSPPKAERPSAGAAVKRRSSGRLWARCAVLSTGAVLIITVTALALLLFLAPQREFTAGTVNDRVQSALQSLIGEAYDIRIGSSGYALRPSAFIALSGKDVMITERGGGAALARIEEITVGLDPFSLLTGAPRFDRVNLTGTVIDLALLPKSGKGGIVHLSPLLTSIGDGVGRLESVFRERALKVVSIDDLTLLNAPLGQRDPAPIRVGDAEIAVDPNGHLLLSASLASALSQPRLTAEWRMTPSGGRQLSLGLGPVSAREWLPSPAVPTEDRGIGLDTVWRLDARFPYNAEGKPEQPFVKLQGEGGHLRVGRKTATPIELAIFNFRLFPERDRIELERSELRADGVKSVMTGAVRPVEPAVGFAGPLEIVTVGEEITGTPFLPGEQPVKARLVAHGYWRGSERRLELDRIQIAADDALFAGTADLVFTGKTPAITAAFASDRFPITAAKQLWPFFLAAKPRDWLIENAAGGEIADLSIDVAIAGDRLSEILRQKGFENSEFSLSAKLDGVRFNTFGDLPALQETVGGLTITDNRLEAASERAYLIAPNGETVPLAAGRFVIPYMFGDRVPAEINVTLAGSLPTIAGIADRAPLNVAEKFAVAPGDLSGKAVAEVTATVDLKKPQSGEKRRIEWAAKVTLEDAASKRPVFGRMVSAADLAINANAERLVVEGTAVIDGIKSAFSATEPLGDAPMRLRKREVTAELDNKQLAALGVDIKPVLDGRVTAKITTSGDAPDHYHIDLTHADIALPWISWLKGAGIPATAEFSLSKANGVHTLSDFSFGGSGLAAKGSLAFSDAGLITADLRDVTLVGSEKFDVAVSKSDNRYTIKASGQDFDGRGVINKLIHADGLTGEAAGSDVSLSANFGRLIGFNGEVMQNALVNYRTDGGFLSTLELRGVFAGRLATIDARREGAATRFDFFADDAGAALAMVDLYRKMRGGRLNASMRREGNGPFTGSVKIDDFLVEGEERLAALVSAPANDRMLRTASGKLQKINTQSIRFDDLRAEVEKGDAYLKVENGRIRNSQIGLTFAGTIYDEAEQMNIRGTFMPLFGISRLVGLIPIVGDIISNGRDQALIGITYRLKGPADNPRIAVNPMSIAAPGIFRQIFEFQE